VKKYPNDCCRCGYCCLVENCKAAMVSFGVPKYGVRCPALRFNGPEATCTIYQMILVDGRGCCIKARAYRAGVEYDFSSLPVELKRNAAKQNLF